MSSKRTEGTVDFTGQYVMSEQENMFEWLKAVGVGMIARNAIHAFGYGIGKAQINISHEGNNFEWETINPKKQFTNSIVIDGSSFASCSSLFMFMVLKGPKEPGELEASRKLP